MSSNSEITLLDATGLGLFVECSWDHDRFTHSVGIVANDVRTVVLTSVEDQPDEHWPCSPPLQQISQQMVEEGPALLGLGIAGQNHYSSSFLLRKEPVLELLVESACSVNSLKVKDHPDQVLLGCLYLASEGFEALTPTTASVKLHSNRSDLPDINLEAHRGNLSTTITKTNTFNNSSILVRPSGIVENKTTQWSYRLRLNECVST